MDRELFTIFIRLSDIEIKNEPDQGVLKRKKKIGLDWWLVQARLKLLPTIFASINVEKEIVL